MTQTLTVGWTRLGTQGWCHKALPDDSYLIVMPHWDNPGHVYLWRHRGPQRDSQGHSVIHAQGQATTAEAAMQRADEHIHCSAHQSTQDGPQ